MFGTTIPSTDCLNLNGNVFASENVESAGESSMNDAIYDEHDVFYVDAAPAFAARLAHTIVCFQHI